MRSLAILLLPLAVLLGCSAGDPCDGQSGTCLSIEMSGSVTALDAIYVQLGGAVQHSFTSDFPARAALPAQVGVLLPDNAQGIVSIMGTALEDSQAVAEGTSQAVVTPGAHVSAVLSLQAMTGSCQGLTCPAPSCADGKKDGAETDVDCGGGACPACAAGKACMQDTDCQSGTCTGGICQSCSEGGADCGGTPAKLVVSPASQDLGTVVATMGATSAPFTFTVSNTGGSSSGTLATTLSGAEFAVVAGTDKCGGSMLAAGAQCTVAVQFAPTSTGGTTGGLSIGADPGGTATAMLSGTGLLPGQITITPSLHDFGAVNAGTLATQTFTVQNTGGGATGTLSTSLTPAAPAFAILDNACGGSSLAGGASCTIEVQFQPAAYGAQNITLAVSATPGGAAAASLAGTGRDTAALTVVEAGSGSGSVTASAGMGTVSGSGISCPGACTQSYYRTTAAPTVTLTAAASAGSTFTGWSGGGCSGSGMCTVMLSAATTVTATFTLACDATSCPAGCCTASGTCLAYSGQSGASCGTGGAACAACANGLCDHTNGSCKTSCAQDSDCATGPCNTCAAQLCLAPLGVGDCKSVSCGPQTCGPVGTFAVGTLPSAIAFDGTNMWVANINGNNVTKLSPTGAILGTFPVGTEPVGIAFDGTNMWVTNNDSSNVTKLSPTGAILGTFAVAASITIAFDGTNMWLSNWGNNTITKLSLTGATLGTFPVGNDPHGIAFDGTHLWVADFGSNNVTQLSLTGATLGTFPVGSQPNEIAFDGTNMWITNYGSNNVTKLSPTGATLGTFAVGTAPAGIAFDGTNMWIVNTGSANVTQLSPTGATLGTFAVGSQPNEIAFDGAHMWVTDNNGDTVTEL